MCWIGLFKTRPEPEPDSMMAALLRCMLIIIIIINALLTGCQTATEKNKKKYNTIGYTVDRLKE